MLVNLSLDDFKNLAIASSSVIATLVFLKGVFEYTKKSAQERAEKFHELRKQFKDNESIKKLLPLLEINSVELVDMPFNEKLDLLGFYEDLALMYKSGLIKKNVVHYMFGYYAIRCWESDNFWASVNRESKYWALFKWFALEMKALEGSFSFNIKKYKL